MSIQRSPAIRDEASSSKVVTPLPQHIVGADFSGAAWAGRQIVETVFENVSFQGADLRGVVFERVLFRHCNWQGACLDEAVLRNVSGLYLLAEGASLRAVRGINTHWIGCFRGADFTGSHWTDSSFYSSDMRETVGVRSFRNGQLRTVSLVSEGSAGEVASRETLVIPGRREPLGTAPRRQEPVGGDEQTAWVVNHWPPFRATGPER